jgi:surface polysaccharide O-acyltransferase-like enzyme
LEPKNEGVNFNVDIIRAVAIVLVVLYHTADFPYKFYNSTITNLDVFNWFTTNTYAAFANFGVPLFVMISGAMLLASEKADEPLRVFAKKRFNRIALAFVFWTIAYFIWEILVVKDIALNPYNVVQGLLTGSNGLLWFLYLIIGLYAVTPIFRVLVKHLQRRMFTFLIVLWFIGTTITPLIHEFTTFTFNPFMFFFFDWIGYFLLGVYLMKTKIRPSRAYLILILGLLVSILGEWWLTFTKGEAATGFFHTYFSVPIIIGVVGMFLVLLRFPVNRIVVHKKFSGVIRWVSKNTLPIYLLHMMVLITLNRGWLKFYLPKSGIELLDVAMWASVTFTATALIVYGLKKIPIINRLIG